MPHYGRIYIYASIDTNKTSGSKECIICHYQYFLDKGFKFQPAVCNGFHYILMIFMNFNDHAILRIYGVNYPCINNGICKIETVNLL